MSHGQFLAWLRSAATAEAAGSGFTVAALPPEELESLAVDLDDVLASASKVQSLLRRLLEGQASNEDLESVLVEAEIELHHAVFHWREVAGQLRRHDMWMETDLGEEEPDASLGKIDEA